MLAGVTKCMLAAIYQLHESIARTGAITIKNSVALTIRHWMLRRNVCARKELVRVWNSCLYGVLIEMDGQIVVFARMWTPSQQASNAASMARALQQCAARGDMKEGQQLAVWCDIAVANTVRSSRKVLMQKQESLPNSRDLVIIYIYRPGLVRTRTLEALKLSEDVVHAHM